jgi:hypothetical protein
MTGKEIIEKYLKENGFDGLCGGYCCGCTLDDLIPCEFGVKDCVPAFLYKPVEDAETQCPDYDKCKYGYSGCLHQGGFDNILSKEDRQCACRHRPMSIKEETP